VIDGREEVARMLRHHAARLMGTGTLQRGLSEEWR